MKEKLLVSACLLGENCKYSGGNNYTPEVEALRAQYEFVPVCPEQLGGLPTPRSPAERTGARVVNRDGADVTEAFRLGAEKTLETARMLGITPDQVEAPVEAGQKLGRLKVLVDGEQVDAIDLVAPQEVPRMSLLGIFRGMLDALFLQET